MRTIVFVLMLAGAAGAGEPLCCGRGATPMGQRPAVPLVERESTWRADHVFAVDGDVEAAVRAVRRVKGVTLAETRPGARWVRVWGAADVVPAAVRAVGEVGASVVPAHEVRVLVPGAHEKGALARAGGAIWRMAGVVDVELEADGDEAVARVWLRPGSKIDDVRNVIARGQRGAIR